jgi:hypothetical protein
LELNTTRNFTLSLDTVPVIIQSRVEAGFVAMCDLHGSKRLIGKGNTRGQAVEDLRYKLEVELKKCFW